MIEDLDETHLFVSAEIVPILQEKVWEIMDNNSFNVTQNNWSPIELMVRWTWLKRFLLLKLKFIVHGNKSRNTVIMRSTDVVLVFILTDQKNACECNCNNVDLVAGDFNLDLMTAFPR